VNVPPWLVRAAVSRRHRVSAGLTAELAAATSMLTTRAPVTALPRFTRVLVLAPHPDDETIGCGGTVARWARLGADIEVVVLTDGEATMAGHRDPAATAAARRSEVTLAAGMLGAGTVVPLGLPDGRLIRSLPTLTTSLGTALVRHQPDVVLLPWPLDGHPDHRAVTLALAAVAPRADCELYGYEVHTPILRPDRIFDVASTLATKRAALDLHRTAARAFEVDATLGLTRWRSLATTAGRSAAEAFLTLAWQDLPRWARLAAQA
jgi:N-acetylglucosamine malate deacetylase 1